MRRREFLSIPAATLGVARAATAALPAGASAKARAGNAVASRQAGKVEIVFSSPGAKPNGLQATPQGLWIMDQGPGNMVHLVSYEGGKVLRSFETETVASSGVTFDGEALWIGSTYSREIVRVDARTGRTIDRYFTPGAGVIYQMAGDAPARSSPLERKRDAVAVRKAAAPKAAQQDSGQQVGGYQQGQVLGSRALGTGAHGQEWRDGRLWMAVPPARMIFCLDPRTWIVQKRFETAGNRPHGIGWEGKYLWCADSNLNAFFKHDPETGEMLEKIQLAETDPLPHGMTIWQGMMWYCDDVGVVCRLRL